MLKQMTEIRDHDRRLRLVEAEVSKNDNNLKPRSVEPGVT